MPPLFTRTPRPLRCFPKYFRFLSTFKAHRMTPISEILQQKNKCLGEVKEKMKLSESDYLRELYKNMNEVAQMKPSYTHIGKESMFVYKEVNLGTLSVYGFDYDYTLVNYTDALTEYIFTRGIEMLVSLWKYPKELLLMRYDPSFLIRGLHYDIKHGFIMKVDAFNNIQADTVYKGLVKVPLDLVEATYKGLYIPSVCLQNSSRYVQDYQMTQLMDFFDLPVAYAALSVIQHFETSGIHYQPECIYRDVRTAIHRLHDSGEVHRIILERPELYIKTDPRLREFLLHLTCHGKSLFLISNSGVDFINRGMNYVVGSDWSKIFDVIIAGANKPDFFRNNWPSFRAVDETGAFSSWESVTQFHRGHFYLGGNLNMMKKLTKWHLKNVLYFGDHVVSDLADASNQWGWATAAVIPELEREIFLINAEDFQKDLQRLSLLEDLILTHQYAVTAVGQCVVQSWRHERDKLYEKTKACINPYFGSVFRSLNNPSFFSQRLGLYASMYTSSVTNLLSVPVKHICYPLRAPLPHEPY